MNIANPPQNLYGIRGYAVNGNGSEIAVASATQVTFLNNSLNVLASTPIPEAFQTSRTAVQFSQDGSRLFLQYDLPVTIEEIDASTYTALGYISGTVVPDDDNLERLLATDSRGHAYVGIDGGLRIVDLTQAPVPNSTPSPNPYPCVDVNAVLPLNTSQQMQLTDTYKSLSVYIGGQPAPLLNGGTAINIPGSSISGPVDIECIDIYGNTAVVPYGVSYGVDPLSLSANLIPPKGSPSAYLFGFGLYTSPFGENPSVTVGGQPVLNMASLGNAGSGGVGLGVIEGDVIQIPNGSPGESADIVVTNSLGTGTLPLAATYYSSSTILPASGFLQLTFDSQRNRLYALKATEVDVLDAATLQWRSPLVFPASAANGAYNAMGLTPDGSKLVVSGLAGTTPQFVVLDPDSGSAPSVLTYSGTQAVEPYGSIAITEFNTVILPGLRGLVLDLSTSTFSVLPLFYGGQVIRASADGSHVYSAALDNSGGEVYSIDPSTYAVQSEQFGQMFWSDLAVSPDGSQFAAVDAPPGYAGANVGFFNSSLQYLNTNVYPASSQPDDSGVIGAAFSPGGTVLVVPLGDSIELWDSAKGTLRARLMTPEELPMIPSTAVAPMIALNSAGQTIYAISASGLMVLTLPEPLDQITPVQWPFHRPGSVRPALHRPLASRVAAIQENQEIPHPIHVSQ